MKLERQEAGGRGQEEQFDGDSTPTNCRHRGDGGVLNPRAGSADSAEISSKKKQPPAFCPLPSASQPKADKTNKGMGNFKLLNNDLSIRKNFSVVKQSKLAR